jgi:zinc transport system ATP-binding protein
MSKQKVIKVEKLNFSYLGEKVLNNLSFSVDEGEYLGIIGPNGGGKTTLIKILLGLLKPSSGKVSIFNQPLQVFHEYHEIGYVPQRIAHGENNFPATVKEIVTSGFTADKRLFYRLTEKDKKVLNEVMDVTDVAAYKNRLIGDLSGGERQRVFIARALASEPKIMILDEPTVGVDISAQKQFYAFLKKLNKTQGITILFITHDLDMIAKEATKVLCLNHNLVCYGLPSEAVDEKVMHDLYQTDMKFVHAHDHDHSTNEE